MRSEETKNRVSKVLYTTLSLVLGLTLVANGVPTQALAAMLGMQEAEAEAPHSFVEEDERTGVSAGGDEDASYVDPSAEQQVEDGLELEDDGIEIADEQVPKAQTVDERTAEAIRAFVRDVRLEAGEETTDAALVQSVYRKLATTVVEVTDADAEHSDDAWAVLAGELVGSKGIARTVVLALRELGLEALVVASPDEAAYWVVVRLSNDMWYHVDVARAARHAENDGENVVVSDAWLLKSDKTIEQADESCAPWHVVDPADAELPVAASDYAEAELEHSDSGESEETQDETVLIDDGDGYDDGDGEENSSEDAEAEGTKPEDAEAEEEKTEEAKPEKTSTSEAAVEAESETESETEGQEAQNRGSKAMGSKTATTEKAGAVSSTASSTTANATPSEADREILPVGSHGSSGYGNEYFDGSSMAIIYNSGELKIGSYLSYSNMYVGWYCGNYSSMDSGFNPWRNYSQSIKTITVMDALAVHDATDMFNGMNNVTSMNLSKLNVSNCTAFARMFSGCTSLKTLNMAGWSMPRWSESVSEASKDLYYNCTSLSTVKVGNNFTFMRPLPEYKVNGRTDWYSASSNKYYTSHDIYLGRDRMADTYTKKQSKMSVANAKVTGVKSSYTYTGSAIKPTPTVTLGGTRLKSGTDYTLKRQNNVKAGTATIVITGKGKYTGTKKVTFKIARRSIAKASLAGVKASYTWTGRAIKPVPTVKLGSRKLKRNTDYTVSWRKNKDAGTATVVVTGKGNYSGTAKKSFRIAGRNISKAKVSGVKKSYTYTGKAIKPNPTVKWGNTKLKGGTHYKLAYKSNVSAGTATVIITGKGNYSGTKKVTFKVARRSIASASITGVKASYSWTGGAIKPNPTVKLGNSKLTRNTHYKVTYRNNVNAGTGTVIITGAGNYSGTKKKTFKIVRTAFYKLQRDTWSFRNPSVDTPLDFCTYLYGKVQGEQLYEKQRLYKADGQCYGMSTTVESIRKYSFPPVTSFSYGGSYASNLYDVQTYWRSSTYNLSAYDYVMYAQISQFEVGLTNEHNKNLNNNAGLVSAVRSSIYGGTPIVIEISGSDYYYSGYDSKGHAIVPIGIKSDTSYATEISVYDCNKPNEAQTLTLYKSNGSYAKGYQYSAAGEMWRYNFDITWATPADNFKSMFTYSHDVHRQWIGSSSRYSLYALSSNMKATIGDEEYDLSEDCECNNDVVIPIRSVAGYSSDDDTRLYWVRDDVGEVTFSQIEEDATISIAAKTGGAEAIVEAGSEVTMDVQNFKDNSVTVCGEDGDEFSVRFFDDVGGKELNETTVTGVVEAEMVEATQVGDEVVVEGATEVVEQ